MTDTDVAVTPILEHDGYHSGDYVKIAGEIGRVFKIFHFDLPSNRPAIVTVYGGVRKKDEWTEGAWRSFTVDRITTKLQVDVVDGHQVVRT